jgi:hypothetical protein
MIKHEKDLGIQVSQYPSASMILPVIPGGFLPGYVFVTCRGRCPGAGRGIVEDPYGSSKTRTSSPAPGLLTRRIPHRRRVPVYTPSYGVGNPCARRTVCFFSSPASEETEHVKCPVVRVLPHPLFW